MNKKKENGFTLIEVISVIVVIGLLIAIAVPGISKYLLESRKKTLVVTINNYVKSLALDVDSGKYSFKKENMIYAVPIECIDVSKGGEDPFGKWYQANDEYFAYVLVQYDKDSLSYNYGFTFKDSAGYGLYPLIVNNINKKGSQINTNTKLIKPQSGNIFNFISFDNWEQSGLFFDENTELNVLEAESFEVEGNNKTTCTLIQKGKNYETVEQLKEQRPQPLVSSVFKYNSVKKSENMMLLNNTVYEEVGLYKTNATNNGETTYYFRGDVDNNYVFFAGFIWRIVRINEDGTIRLILQDGVFDNKTYSFTSESNFEDTYYSNSDSAKNVLNYWYDAFLKSYDSYIEDGMFCEQFKVKENQDIFSGDATPDLVNNYKASFECIMDGNKKGNLNLKIGLINYDELMYAGGYYGKESEYYLNNGYEFFTMSPAGYNAENISYIWGNGSYGIEKYDDNNEKTLRPVINLKADVMVTGKGTKDDMFTIKLEKDIDSSSSTLSDLIKKNSAIIVSKPTLNIKNDIGTDSIGLYLSTDTNNKNATYYYRGKVNNNYVSFAGKIWRIVRINEDGTVRLVLDSQISGNKFNSSYYGIKYLYYSNSDAKKILDTWYEENLYSYDDYIAEAMFCEQAKIESGYTPNFKCSFDANDKGILNLKIGLVSYDEIVYGCNSFGLGYYSSMTPGNSYAPAWVWCNSSSGLASCNVNNSHNLKPVINLKADVIATGLGFINNMYIIQTN